MVMDGSDVVGATSGTVGVVGRTAEVASGVVWSLSGARHALTVETPVVLSWEGLQDVQNSPPTDSICRE